VHPHTDDGSANTGALRPGTSVGQVFAFVAGFVALAAVGATLGWTLTKTPGNATLSPPTGSSPPVVVSSPPLSPSPSLPSPSPSSPVASPTGFVIPDYFAEGADFQIARNELIDQKMAVVLIFDPANTTADPGSVERTQPPAGAPGRKGLTVKMYVAGAAPALAIPAPDSGVTCEMYAKVLVATGFTVAYQGNTAQAKRNKPADSIPQWTTNSTWNTQIRLICTPDGSPPPTAPPTDTASPTPTDTQTPP
jgi:hypothetical protein